MEFIRVTRDAWGQETLEGISWDLIPEFVAVAAVIIVAHALYMWLVAPKHKEK